jgi:hypothetical protein
MTVSSKQNTAKAANQARSIYDVVMSIVNSPTKNLVRVPADYEAENAGNAQTAAALGESGRGQGQGVGHEVSSKLTGLAFNAKGGKLTIILNILDKTHRENAQQSGGKAVDKRNFQFATRTVADLTDPSRRLDYLEVCDNFQKWNRISLTQLPLFPTLSTSEEAEAFKSAKLGLLSLGTKINILNKKCTSLKKKANKQSVSNSKGTCCYVPPKGNTTMIVDKEGKRVASIPRKVNNRGMLWASVPQSDNDNFPAEWLVDGKLSSDLQMLPTYMMALKEMRRRYETLNTKVRPFECGLIERSMSADGIFPERLSVAGTWFEIHINSDTEYDKPADCAAKIKSGEYTEKEVPTTRGSWEVHEKAEKEAKVKA